MATTEPLTELDSRYSDPAVKATGWEEAVNRWKDAELYWLSTVRPDGRPHVTPLISVWLDGASHFCTGPEERKAKNLRSNPNVVLTTGSNDLSQGLDLVVEGTAIQVTDDALLRRIADAYEEKYGPDWHFDVRHGAFVSSGGRGLVFQVRPIIAFGFAKGAYGQTRWCFDR